MTETTPPPPPRWCIGPRGVLDGAAVVSFDSRRGATVVASSAAAFTASLGGGGGVGSTLASRVAYLARTFDTQQLRCVEFVARHSGILRPSPWTFCVFKSCLKKQLSKIKKIINVVA